MKSPVILIGIGEMGSVFARGLLRSGHPVYPVTRTTDLAETARLLPSPELVNQLVLRCQDRGLILFWLLFEPRAVRITPPLTISEDEILAGCNALLGLMGTRVWDK